MSAVYSKKESSRCLRCTSLHASDVFRPCLTPKLFAVGRHCKYARLCEQERCRPQCRYRYVLASIGTHAYSLQVGFVMSLTLRTRHTAHPGALKSLAADNYIAMEAVANVTRALLSFLSSFLFASLSEFPSSLGF
jgi:hypothetical protein